MADHDRVAGLLRDLGVPDDVARRAIERGDPEGAILESTLTPAREERTMSAADVEPRGGLAAGEVVEIFQAMGFPRPDPTEPILTPEEAQVFVELAELREIWPHELSRQLARMYGRLLSRIARTGVQFFRLYAEPRLIEAADTREEQLASMREAFARMGNLPDPLLAGVHRRWIEYEVAQTAVTTAQTLAPDLELAGAVEISLLFCDLKDFTAFATAEGDAAAVAAVDRFVQTIDVERGEDGRIVKALGDGQMLAYTQTGEAVRAGSRIIAAMREQGPLHVHASVHCGTAIVREGDYFGGVVNLAARLLAVAGAEELVATRSVVEACGGSYEWTPLGLRHIRGVAERVEVFLLAG
jgi:adenylate cyclase